MLFASEEVHRIVALHHTQNRTTETVGFDDNYLTSPIANDTSIYATGGHIVAYLHDPSFNGGLGFGGRTALDAYTGVTTVPGEMVLDLVPTILDGNNKLVPEIAKILKIVKEYNMVLANGHISPQETFALVEAAQALGIKKLVITHGLWTNGLVRFTLDELKKLGQMGCYIENCYVGFLPTDFRNDPKPMVDAIKYIGAEHCIISTDLGQYYNPSPAEGMRMFIALLYKNGIPAPEIEAMAKKNPAKLLDLD